MALDSIYGWSQTAASNGAADTTINFAEFQTPASLNDSCRALMARIAQFLSDAAPNRTSTGSANAYAVTSDAAGAALTNCEQITFIPNADNTGACTINVDGRGAKPWRPAPSVEFVSGNILNGVPVTAYYRSATDEWLSPGTGYYVSQTASGVALQTITARLPQIGDLVVSYAPTPGPGRIRLTESTQSILKSAYPELNSYLSGIAYPWGSTATNFSLPPAAGYFLRFASTSSAIDTSGARAAGSTQSDQNKAHTHTVSTTGTTSSDGAHTHSITGVPAAGTTGTTGGGGIAQTTTTYTTSSNGTHSHTVTSTGTAATDGSDEVRVKNVAFYVDVVASTALAAAQLAVFGFPFTWDTGTTDANPGTAKLRIDNAALASASYLYISNTDGWGVTLTGIYAAMTANAVINISRIGAQANRLTMYVTGTPVAGSGYYKIPVVVLSSAGAFAASDQLAFEFSLTSADSNVTAATAQAVAAAASAAAAAASAASFNRTAFASSRTVVAGLDVTLYDYAVLTESGRDGLFVRVAGSTPTDTAQGLYVASSTSGHYWQRLVSGPLNVKWFGATGDGSTDDVTAINAAITVCSAANGGQIFFPAGTYMISTSILLKRGVSLVGVSAGVDNVSNLQGTKIKPSANMTAMITQADITSLLHTVSIENICLDGDKATKTVDHIILLSPVNSRIKHCHIGNATGNGITWKANSVAAWIGWIQDNSIEHCNAYGIDFEGTDTRITGNYLSSCATNCRIRSTGGVQFANNMLDLATSNALVLEGHDLAAQIIVQVVGNYFAQNAVGILVYSGTTFSTILAGVQICGNIFHANTSYDIDIGSGCRYGVITGNQFNDNAGTNNIRWNATNTGGWIAAPNSFDAAITDRFSGLPASTMVMGGGEGGQLNRLSRTVVTNLTSGVATADAVANFYGSDTVLGQANTVARFGVTRNSSTFDSALLVANVNGNLPLITAVDGETTAAVGFALGFRGTSYIGIDATGVAITGNAHPQTTDGAALGTSAVMWSDLFLASGGVIDFNSGDVKVTHSADALAFTGASTGYTFDAPVAVASSVLSSHATAGIGYATGAGGTVTQATSRTMGVTLNKAAGAITLFTAAGTATATSFTVTNSTVAATDTIQLSVKSSTTNKYLAFVTAVAAGSFEITFYTTGGTTSDTPVINFAVLKAVAT